MMRRCAGFNTDEAWHQDITSLQMAADDHVAYRVDTVDLKNRLSDVETDRRDPWHAALLRIVVTPAATTSMALTCRWRSRPQHQEPTSPPETFTLSPVSLLSLIPVASHFDQERTSPQG